VIKQFIPEGACLKCRGCCRFREEDSVWAPCLLDEEIQDLLGKEKELPAVSISPDKRIHPVALSGHEEFICPFLESQSNKCKIYHFRPFECQIYPFLINLRRGQAILTVDLNCPYIKENLNSKEFKEYSEYLAAFLNSPGQLRLLKDNPQILQAYEDVLDVIELSTPDEIA